MTTVGEMTQSLIEDVARGLEEAGWKPGGDPINGFPDAVYRRIRDSISRIENNSYQLGRKLERDRRDYEVSCLGSPWIMVENKKAVYSVGVSDMRRELIRLTASELQRGLDHLASAIGDRK